MEQVKALTFSYNNAGQDIIFSPDAISGISDSLDQVGAPARKRRTHSRPWLR